MTDFAATERSERKTIKEIPVFAGAGNLFIHLTGAPFFILISFLNN